MVLFGGSSRQTENHCGRKYKSFAEEEAEVRARKYQ